MKVQIFTIIILFFACKSPAVKNQSPGYQINEEAITVLDFLLEKDLNEESKIHFMADEFFNDSTYLAKVWINGFEPEKKVFIDSISHLNNRVYLYDIASNPEISQQVDVSAFYVPDSKAWQLLVMRRKKGTQILKVSIIEKYDDNLIEDDVLIDQF